MSTIIEERRYILTNLGGNNNKFWHVSLKANGELVTEWGRVGATRQSKTFLGENRNSLLRRCREKENKGYREQQVMPSSTTFTAAPSRSQLKQIVAQEIKTTSDQTKILIESLVEWNVHQILAATTLTYNQATGAFATPLGIINQSAIEKARTLLTNVREYVAKNDFDSAHLTKTVNELLMLVPKGIGRSRKTPADLFPNLTAVEKENELLDMLEANLSPASKPELESKRGRVFDVELAVMDKDEPDFKQIVAKYRDTRNHYHVTHNLRVSQIYRVEINGMKAAYEVEQKRIGNTMRLWHGTRKSNLLSILQNGLRCPPPATAKITGKMFGDGIYFSDQSTKSLNYSFGYWQSGAGNDDHCFMFLADVAMGKTYTPGASGFCGLPRGYDSTFARAGSSGVVNNEMIVYRNSQCNLSYLVEFGR